MSLFHTLLPALMIGAMVAPGGAAPAAAQSADPALLQAEREAMTRLAWMDGSWRGEAVTTAPDGPHRVTQTERIGPLLGGTIKLIEGKALRADGSTGFNAFGVVSYDSAGKRYTLHSYAQGHAGDFVLTPTATGYVWEIPLGAVTIRYTATLKDGVWNEVGDRVTANQPPQRFFEMNLKRLGDSAWPGEGAQAR
ncbi:DUF1579 domain-containing protein [Sphingomonas sp. RT2P30]|uniref:DUF1579 domain-containing protein n=1 Tax=Parasphingomonas halimpatiens TaxID=3096162 RepID=UPI002FC883C3